MITLPTTSRQNEPELDRRPSDEFDEAAVLLHGLAANRLAMLGLARRLETRGFRVRNWGYPSTRRSIEHHANWLVSRLAEFCDSESFEKVHLVTHSMGSIVARRSLSQFRPQTLGRIVMLGPPNGGSDVARRLARRLGWICPPLHELSDAPDSYVNRLGEPDNVEIGIIAAAADRVVPLASTYLACQSDHVILPGHHGMLPWRRDTADQVVHFLRSGSFV